jgi:hypothetical protein
MEEGGGSIGSNLECLDDCKRDGCADLLLCPVLSRPGYIRLEIVVVHYYRGSKGDREGLCHQCIFNQFFLVSLD